MSKKELVPTVAIDHLSGTYLEYLEKRRAVAVLTGEMEKLEAKLREAVGTNFAATIFDEVVITNRPTKRLRARELEEDNPDLYKEYTEPKLVDVFNAEKFQAEHPALYQQYQSRSFLFKEAK